MIDSLLIFRDYLLKINRPIKQIIVLVNDIIISFVAIFIALFIENSFSYIEYSYYNLIYILFSTIIFIPFYIAFGLYNSIFRYSGINSIRNILLSSILYSLFILSINFFSYQITFPFNISILQVIIFTILITSSRLIPMALIRFHRDKNSDNLIIFGTSEYNFRLLNIFNDYNILGFVDEDESKVGKKINGLKIYSLNTLDFLSNIYPNLKIIIAIKNLSLENKLLIVDKLKDYNVKLRFLPNLDNIINGKEYLNVSTSNITIADVIQRKIKWDKENIKKIIAHSNVLITGSGGFIGSELSRQIIEMNPNNLLLLDNTEFNLYKVNNQVKNIINENNISCNIILLLVSINNKNLISFYINKYKPKIIFHAAAYKHVPLTENNISEVLRNNVFGTLNLVEAAVKYNVEKFIFISSDKAVRPSNIMGASKRMGELIIQSFSNDKNLCRNTTFSIIRFGNVLGSTGSVVPLFNSQIINKKLITITHPEVSRYFMTITEAVGLVLSSVSIGRGGEVFVLNMGEPIKIIDLARRMIKLHGFLEKTKNRANGDIEIKFIGLRAGEKLHEELLISNLTLKTLNKDLFIAKENFILWPKLKILISDLKKYIENDNIDEIIKILESSIEDFHSGK